MYSTPFEILIFNNIIVAIILITNSKTCEIAFLYAFLIDVKYALIHDDIAINGRPIAI